jgi:DNA-binding GntR family transcriptional regulator
MRSGPQKTTPRRAKAPQTSVIARGATAEVVSRALREEILEGQFADAEPLRQDAIAKRFNTSRVPVREALRQLEAEGLVTFEPHRGACVTTLKPSDVLEMLEIRLALETHVLRLAVPNMTQSDFDTANETIAQYRRNVSAVEWDRMNWQFHATLYLPAHRPRLFTMIQNNYFHAASYLRVKIALATGSEKPHEEHKQILEACRLGDADKAVKLLETHIGETRKRLATEFHRATIKKR